MSMTRAARAGRLLLVVLLGVAWTNVPLALATKPSRAVLRSKASASAEPNEQQVLALLHRLVAAGEQELRGPGADPADIQAKAADLGYDVARTFAFVRDEIRYEPYRGVLRGARGALSSGGGNSFDKTLLLAALLETGGHQVRLMRGQLPPDRAEALVRQFLERGGSFPTADSLLSGPTKVPGFMTEAGFAQSDIEAMVAEGQAEVRQFMQQASARAAAEADYLKAQIDAAGIKLGRSHEDWMAELSARATDHLWLKVIGTDGTATALDASFAGSQAGDSAAGDGTVMEEDALAAERHVIVFELLYGVKEGDGRVRKQLLEVPLYADEALYSPPMLTIQPADPLPPMEAMLNMSKEELIKLFTGFKQYQAVVRVGNRHWASPAFDLKGNITPISADGRVAGAQQLGGAIGRGFEDALGGGGEEEEAEANNFIDLSVMLTFRSPGAEPAKQERLLLTQAQTTGEEFLSPILDWKMLIQPQPLTPKLVGYEGLRSMIGALGPALPLMDPALPASERLERLKGVRASTFPTLLVSLSMFRQLAAAQAVAAAPSVALWDRPQMSIAESRFCANAEENRTCGRSAIDLVDNGLSFLPRTEDGGGAAAEMAMRQGVFDTVAEAIVLAQMNETEDLGGAIGDLGAVREAGGSLVAAAARDEMALGRTSLDEGDRAWIASYEPGRQILAPGRGKTILSAWWSVDPSTGNVLGRRDGGRGQSQTEYLLANLLVGLICIGIVIRNFVLDRNVAVASGGGMTEGQLNGAFIAILGCVVGALTGTMGSAYTAKRWVLFWIVANGAIAGAFSAWGSDAARPPMPGGN